MQKRHTTKEMLVSIATIFGTNAKSITTASIDAMTICSDARRLARRMQDLGDLGSVGVMAKESIYWIKEDIESIATKYRCKVWFGEDLSAPVAAIVHGNSKFPMETP